MTKRGYATWLGLLLAGAMACGGGGETESGEGGDESSGGEHADLSAFEGPVTGDSAAGEPVFANFCAGCHPGGGAGVGPDLHNRTDSTAEVRAIIRHGEDRMPGFGADQISDEDLENVLAYLTSFGMFQ